MKTYLIKYRVNQSPIIEELDEKVIAWFAKKENAEFNKSFIEGMKKALLYGEGKAEMEPLVSICGNIHGHYWNCTINKDPSNGYYRMGSGMCYFCAKMTIYVCATGTVTLFDHDYLETLLSTCVNVNGSGDILLWNKLHNCFATFKDKDPIEALYNKWKSKYRCHIKFGYVYPMELVDAKFIEKFKKALDE